MLVPFNWTNCTPNNLDKSTGFCGFTVKFVIFNDCWFKVEIDSKLATCELASDTDPSLFFETEEAAKTDSLSLFVFVFLAVDLLSDFCDVDSLVDALEVALDFESEVYLAAEVEADADSDNDTAADALADWEKLVEVDSDILATTDLLFE